MPNKHGKRKLAEADYKQREATLNELDKVLGKTKGRNRMRLSNRTQMALRARGYGTYDMGSSPTGLIGRGLGGVAGAITGRGFKNGWNAGAHLSRMVGAGDYATPWKVSMNSLVSAGSVPQVHGDGTRMRLQHSEYIGSVLSSSVFTNRVYRVNPGISATFPWLSRLAANFQQYRLHGAMVAFKSSLTNAVADFESLGALIIAADMNSAADAAGSQVQMEQMQFVASSKPNNEIVAPIECAVASGGAGVRYVRSVAVPALSSINDYDHCMIQVATAGQPSAGVELGRLYLTYDIELINPKMISNPGAAAHYYKAGNDISQTVILGTTSPPTLDYDGIGVKFPLLPGTGYRAIEIPANTGPAFLLNIEATGSPAVMGDLPITYVNCAGLPWFGDKTAVSRTEPVATTTGVSTWGFSLAFKVTDLSAVSRLEFGTCVHIGASTKMDIVIIPLPTMASNLGSMVTLSTGNYVIGGSPTQAEEKVDDIAEEPVDLRLSGAAAGAGFRKALRP